MNQQDRDQLKEMEDAILGVLNDDVMDQLRLINGTVRDHEKRISHIEGARESEGRFANITPGRAAFGGGSLVTAIGAAVYGIVKLVEMWPA